MTAFTESLKLWINATVGFLYPESCQCCGARATSHDCFLCSGCQSQVRFIQPPFCERCGLPYEGEITTRFQCSNCREMDLHFRTARSAAVAGEKVLEMIHPYKYHR